MIRFVVKRRIINSFTGQVWRSLQQSSRMSACPVKMGPFVGGSGSLVPRARGSCWGLLSLRQSACSLQRVRPFHCSVSRLQKKPSQSQEPEPEPQPRELDLIRYDMKDLMKGPKPALYLGFSGLIPFVAAPLIMGVTELYFPEVAYAQVAYGASIVSFLGGARWGFALPEGSPAKPDWLNLANSVVPSLLAWVALLFRDSITEATLMVIMGLGISLHYDLALLPGYPSWFKALRTILTGVATFSLVATLILKGIYPEKKLSFGD